MTPEQLITINRTINHRNHLIEQNNILSEEVELLDSMVVYWKCTAALKDSTINMERRKFEAAENVKKTLERSLLEQEKRSRKTIIGVGAGGILSGVLLGILLKNN